MSGLNHDMRAAGRRRARFGLWTAVMLASSLALPLSLWAANGSSPVHTYNLMPQVQGQVFADGSVAFWQETVAGGQLLLQIHPPLFPTRRQAAVQDTLFAGIFAEGDPGGHRAFARDADDDGDGLVDEDRVDGRDNDGDGAVDEDFAAISDAMVVIDRVGIGRRLHLETYHWSYCHLRAALMVSCLLEDAQGRPLDESLVLEAAAGIWTQADFRWRVFGASGVSEAREGALFVTTVADPKILGKQAWLGVSPLPPVDPRRPTPRATLENSRLTLPMQDGQTKLAVSIAPTYLQLIHNMSAARAVHKGSLDLTGQKRIAWIVPPLCQVSLKGEVPAVRWEAGQGGWRLVFAVQPGQYALFDPDRFQVQDVSLRSPRWITWTTEEALAPNQSPADVQKARSWSRPWQHWTLESIWQKTVDDLDPYHSSLDLLRHLGQGELAFEFAGQPPWGAQEDQLELSGACLSGRMFKSVLESPPSEPDQPEASLPDLAAGDMKAQLRNGSGAPMLSPELLENFPNPFRMQTNIRYRIPATVGEGFVWETKHDPGLDPSLAIPYQSTQPFSSLKVYSISGQEIATLFEGALGIGQYEASWDGTDAGGRPVASGTYFCKLQIENWSVTKRLVFLR